LGGWVLAPPKVNPAIGPVGKALILAGAKDTFLILDGEWWRFISPSFLHAGIIHILLNMLALLFLLYEMEPIHGWKPLLAIFVMSGVFSTGCSALFLPVEIMVGSSGAIFGLMGAQLSDLIQNWTVFYHPYKHLLFISVVTGLNLLLGFMPFLDNFAHVGGTIMGILCGLVLLNQEKVDRLGFHRPNRCYRIVAACVSVVLIILFFVTIFALLYGRKSPNDFCPSCENMSCVTFPPRSKNPWWDCSTCSKAGFSVTTFQNGTFILQCPLGKKTSVGYSPPQFPKTFFLDFCKSQC